MNPFEKFNGAPDVLDIRQWMQQQAAQKAQSQQPKQPEKKGNFLTSLIPSGGGIAGAAGGAAIGSAIAPGIGTLLGALLGGAVGGGAGKVAENAVEGQQNLGQGVGQEALINGVLGAGPLRLLKGGVDLARGVKAGTGLADAVAQAGQGAVNSSVRGTVGNKLTNASNDLVVKNFRLTPSQLNNFQSKFGEDASQTIKKYGLVGQDSASIQQKIMQPLQDEFNNVATTIPNLSAKELETGLKKIYNPLLNSPAQFERQLGAQIKSQADDILNTVPSKTFIAGAKGEVARAGGVDANEASKRLSQIDKLISKSQTTGGVTGNDLRALVREKQTLEAALKGGTTTVSEIPASKVNEIRKIFDSAVGYTQRGAPEYNVIKETADALRGTLQNAADKAGVKASNGMSFKEVGQELSKLHQLTDNIANQEQLGRGSLPFGLGNTPGAVIGSAGGVPGAILGAGANAAINSPAARTLLAKGAEKVGTKLTEQAASRNPYSLGQLGLRLGSAGAVQGALDQPSLVNSASTAPSTTTPTTMDTNNMGTSYTNGADMSSGMGVDQGSPYSQANLMNDIQRDPKNADKYLAYYSSMQKAFASPSAKPLNATQLQQANNANSGLGDLQTIAQEIQQDPSVLIKDAIPGGGIARRLTGTNNYEAAKQNVVDVISRLRSGAAITQDEANRYMGLLPGATDTAESATQKLQRLGALLSSFANPQAAQPDLTSSPDLVNALMGSQGGY